MSLGRMVLRTTVGGYFTAHGTQKLFGWFGGGGLDGTAALFEQLGLRPGQMNAILAGVTETAGGTAILLGAATPFAAAGLIATMVTAIRKVHGANGPFVTDQGYEYNLVLIAALAALVEVGPGDPSVDGESLAGPAWAAIAIALGMLGSFGTEPVFARLAPPAEEAIAPSEVSDAPANDAPAGAPSQD